MKSSTSRLISENKANSQIKAGEPEDSANALHQNTAKRDSEAAEEQLLVKRRAELSDFEKSIVEKANLVELPFKEARKNLNFDVQEEEKLRENKPRRDSMASLVSEMRFDTSDDELEHTTRLNTLQNSIIYAPLETVTDLNTQSPISVDTALDQVIDPSEEENHYNPAQPNHIKRPARKTRTKQSSPDTNEKFGLKRKMVQSSQNLENRRYPVRNRIKPVMHFRNERIVYDENGFIIGADIKDEGYLTRSDAKVYNRPPKKEKARKEVPQDKCVLPIYDSLSKRDKTEKVIYPKTNMHMEEDSKGKIGVIVEDTKMKLQMISLKPGDYIDLGKIDSRIVGFVMMSESEKTHITIHENAVFLSQWDSFIVPPKNTLTIKNSSHTCASKVHLHIEKL